MTVPPVPHHPARSSAPAPALSSRSSMTSLVRAAADGGLGRIVSTLQRLLDAPVALFDLGGSMLSSSSIRDAWDFEEVLGARSQPPGAQPLTVFGVEVGREVIALLAARVSADVEGTMAIAADLVGLDVARLRARQEGRRELAAHVLEDIIDNGLSERDAASTLPTIGIDPERSYRVLLGTARTRQERLLTVPWNVYALMSDRDDPFVRVIIRGAVLMIVPDDQMVHRIAQTLLQHMADLGSDARVGVASAYRGGVGIRAGYYEALGATQLSPGVNSVAHVDLSRLLVHTNTAIPLDELVRTTLGPLLTYDAQHGGELVKTLRAFLSADRVAASAADALFIHRNTLRYRLRQIEELLGLPLESTANIANLWTALTALPDAAGKKEQRSR